MNLAESIRQGWADYQSGNFAPAERAARLILQSEPRSADAWLLLASASQALGKSDDAIAGYRQAALLRPDVAETHYRLGNALYAKGLLPEALASYQQARLLRPQHPETHNNIGVVLADQGLPVEAILRYREAIRLNPRYAEAYYNLGNALKAQDRLDEAVDVYRQAINANPEFAPAYLNLGIALSALGKPDEAEACYREAIRLEPNAAKPHNNLGLALAQQNRLDEALASYERSLQLQPDFADAHYNRALAFLVRGEFAEGWREYEWRWQLAEIPKRVLPRPLWDGAPLQGRTILLHAEQGFGDTIQFIRFAPLVRERGGRVIVDCPEKMIPLLRTCPAIDAFSPRGVTLPPFDVHAPLMSLPRIVGTTLETIPANIPYLSAEPNRIEQWREKLSRYAGCKVGIAWQGSPGYRWDRQRSLRLSEFQPIARLAGVHLFSLQKGLGTEQLRAVPTWWPIAALGSVLDENTGAFVETAAVLKNLDLVITCDTALGHLAGALGLPVWILQPFAPEWRWLLDRDDSPWYPSVRLFRQTRPNDWPGVFEWIAMELQKRLGTSQRALPIVAPLAPGELLDKITILEIKSERIADPVKLGNVRHELEALDAVRRQTIADSTTLAELVADLRAVNAALWDIEDAIRICERHQDFGSRFIDLARSVYQQNDRRSAIKRRINEWLGSEIMEEKSYNA